MRYLRRADHDGIAVLSLDYPGRTLNVIDEHVLAELGAHLDDVLADQSVAGVVLASGKPGSFGAGADVTWLPSLAARDDAESFLSGIHALKVRIAGSPKPVVTAIEGVALGGALELALAGHEIVAARDAVLGLPEVTLELLPGGGGTQMLLRWVTVETALGMLTGGLRVPAEQAHAKGLVTRLAGEDEELLDVAVSLAKDQAGKPLRPVQPRVDSGAQEALKRHRQQLSNSRAGLALAAAAILEVVAVGLSAGIEDGLSAERDAFLKLLRSARARAALHLFQAESNARRRSRSTSAHASSLGVVGAGQMGSGIAATAVSRGLRTVVRDTSNEALERARGYRDHVLDRAGSTEDDPRRELWTATLNWDGFESADAVVEAVFELPDLKTAVLRDVCSRVGNEALIATNTSAISIAHLANAITHSQRFLGMHFFSPVDRMPLVELIPHAGTSSETAQRAASLGRQLGKTPVVVGDAPGFFTSRVYARWLVEGVRLLLDGVSVESIDRAARADGFRVGPLQAHDEATLQLVVDASITQVADEVLASRINIAPVRDALEALIAVGVGGRRAGAGFYRYIDGRRSDANPTVATTLGVPPADLNETMIRRRLLLAFVTESLLCWDEGILCHPDDGDLAAVLGVAFPRALGGPFHWADEKGHDVVRRLCRELGPAFPISTLLGAQAYASAVRTDMPRMAGNG